MTRIANIMAGLLVAVAGQGVFAGQLHAADGRAGATTKATPVKITVTSSSNYDTRHTPENTLDNDFTGRHFWAGKPGEEPWTLEYDLGAKRKLGGLCIAFYDRTGLNSHVAKKTTVEISSDGKTWKSLGELPAPGPWTERIYRLAKMNFSREGRHIRLIMTAAPTGKQPAVWGVQFYTADGKVLDGAETFTEKNAAGLGTSKSDLSDLKIVRITSTKDGSRQPARLYLPPPEFDKPVPLLVLLHTWSGGYMQNSFVPESLAECRTRRWALLIPHFRGPNWTPQACASELAVQDVLDAVAYVRKRRKIDGERIYVFGQSGGGHMTMMMASKAPQLWAGASAWVGISDLAAWHGQCKKAGRGYYKHLEKVCGGPPGASTRVDKQYHDRSPLFFLSAAKGLPVDINVGIHDGHTGSVPTSHSLNAFNVLAEVNGQPGKKLTAGQIEYITTRRKIPAGLQKERVAEKGRRNPILFRRSAGPARLTVFDGGHVGEAHTAIRWLAKQSKQPQKPAKSLRQGRMTEGSKVTTLKYDGLGWRLRDS